MFQNKLKDFADFVKNPGKGQRHPEKIVDLLRYLFKAFFLDLLLRFLNDFIQNW